MINRFMPDLHGKYAFVRVVGGSLPFILRCEEPKQTSRRRWCFDCEKEIQDGCRYLWSCPYTRCRAREGRCAAQKLFHPRYGCPRCVAYEACPSRDREACASVAVHAR